MLRGPAGDAEVKIPLSRDDEQVPVDFVRKHFIGLPGRVAVRGDDAGGHTVMGHRRPLAYLSRRGAACPFEEANTAGRGNAVQEVPELAAVVEGIDGGEEFRHYKSSASPIALQPAETAVASTKNTFQSASILVSMGRYCSGSATVSELVVIGKSFSLQNL